MRESEVLRLLAELSAAWAACNPNGAGAMPEETRVLYVEHLHDLDFEATRDAIRFIIRGSNFFPSVAHIRSAVVERRSGLPEPEIALGEVLVALRKFGRDRKPVFFNAATEAAVHALGWANLCNSDESSMPANRAHFMRLYEACRKRIHLAIEDGSVELGTGTARRDALRAAGVNEPETIFVAPGEDPMLPPAVAEMRFRSPGDVVGKVIARIDLDPQEKKGRAG